MYCPGCDLKQEINDINIGKGMLAGALGGFIGALTMSGFASVRLRLTRPSKTGNSRSELPYLEASRYVSGSSLELDSIALAADRIDRLTGHKMSPRQKALTAAGVHVGLGAFLGAIYGTLAEVDPVVTRWHGTGFAVVEGGGGNLVWTAATRSMSQYSLADHADSIADHAVFGLTLETVRRLIRGSDAG